MKKSVEIRIQDTLQIDFVGDELMVLWSDDPSGSYDPSVADKMVTSEEVWSHLIRNAYDNVRELLCSRGVSDPKYYNEWGSRFSELLEAMDPPEGFNSLLEEMRQELHQANVIEDTNGWHKVKPEDFGKYVKKQKYPKNIQKELLSVEDVIPKVIEEMTMKTKGG